MEDPVGQQGAQMDPAERQARATEKLLRLHQAVVFWALVVVLVWLIVWLASSF